MGTSEPSLSLSERHSYILDKLRKERTLRIMDLCKALKVSSVTMRKDVNLLHQKGLLYKTHGAISFSNPYTTTKPIHEKEFLQVEEKKSIAAYAASLIKEDDAIILASGTTILQLARHIPSLRMKVICSSLEPAALLSQNEKIEVFQLGGFVRRSSTSVVGHFAEKMLESFSCNKLFLGVDGIDLQFGCTITNMHEANLNRVMMKIAQQTIILADSTKFGKRGFGKICEVSQVDQIITDDGLPASVVKTLKQSGIDVTIVPRKGTVG